MTIDAIEQLDGLLDLAELSPRLIGDAWRRIMALRGWDGADGRCRLDNPTPYR